MNKTYTKSDLELPEDSISARNYFLDINHEISRLKLNILSFEELDRLFSDMANECGYYEMATILASFEKDGLELFNFYKQLGGEISFCDLAKSYRKNGENNFLMYLASQSNVLWLRESLKENPNMHWRDNLGRNILYYLFNEEQRKKLSTTFISITKHEDYILDTKKWYEEQVEIFDLILEHKDTPELWIREFWSGKKAHENLFLNIQNYLDTYSINYHSNPNMSEAIYKIHKTLEEQKAKAMDYHVKINVKGIIDHKDKKKNNIKPTI